MILRSPEESADRISSPGLANRRPVSTVAFQCLTGVLALPLGAVLAWGLGHRSSEAVVFGRYSVGYACSLAAMTLGFCWLIAALFRPQSRLASWLANTYLALCATLVPLGLIEIGLRVIDPWGVSMFGLLSYHMQGMVTHPVLGYEHPRSVEYSLGHNVVRLNPHGLRSDEPIPFGKRPGERRILALGDSVTFGWGVSQGETFSDVLQGRLRASSTERWTVINAGVNGYNTEQAVTYFLQTGYRYEPDIVVMTFVHNDVDPRIVPNESRWRRYPSLPPNLPELGDRIRKMSYVYQLPMFFAKAQRRDSAPFAAKTVMGLTDHPGWTELVRALERLRDECATRNIHLLVSIEIGTDKTTQSAIESLGIETTNWQSAWDAIPEERQRVSRVDAHPTREVHAYIGEDLHSELVRRGWLAPR